jgi:hypothetical protein
MLDMRFMHCGDAVKLDELDDSQEPLPDVSWECVELTLDSLIQDLDAPHHMRHYISKKR